jgi:hypothetical protein
MKGGPRGICFFNKTEINFGSLEGLEEGEADKLDLNKRGERQGYVTEAGVGRRLGAIRVEEAGSLLQSASRTFSLLRCRPSIQAMF